MILRCRIKKKNPGQFKITRMGRDLDILVYVKPGLDAETQWRICLPKNMVKDAVKWFHLALGHPGYARTYDTMRSRYYSQHLSYECRQFKCEDCQKHKADGRGWGLLPEREVTAEPFEEVAVDLIGPWKIPVGNRTVEFNALTCIDMASNLVELVRIKNKTSSHVSHKFAQTWLARYPRYEKVIHDNGGEFIGPEFQSVLRAYEICSANTSSKNPQANAVCERMHQTVANILRTLLSDAKPKNVTHANEIIDEALALAMFALRATIHTTLGSSPGSLAFNRDMLLNIPLVADWHMIMKRREHLINANIRRENRKRR